MDKQTFIKVDGEWYFHFCDELREFNQSELALLEGSDQLLDQLAKGKEQVTLLLDTEPMENARQLELLEHCDAPMGGGYYQMRSHTGRVVESELWLCDVPLFVFGDIPERFYIKRVSNLIGQQ